MPVVDRLTIVGPGLIGGSLGMAVKRHHLAKTVVGLSRRPSTLRQAKARGAIDVGTTDPRRAVEDADLVVIAAPVDAIIPCAKRLAPFMRRGSVLTDVGSTKGQIVHALERALPPVAFVGAHPLAGSEQRGLSAARAELFDGSVCVLTATRRTDHRALQTVRRLWKPLVRRVVVMDPRRHDRLLAAVSHLPHLLAFCLVAITDEEALAVAPRSFLEATRVARSDPGLWDDILLTNRKALLAEMGRFDHHWHALRTRLLRGDRPALLRLLASAKTKRDALRP